MPLCHGSKTHFRASIRNIWSLRLDKRPVRWNCFSICFCELFFSFSAWSQQEEGSSDKRQSVANLATFTAYHPVVDHSSLLAYVGFFAIIWVSWFHTVLHDVRFEHDSIYSRACKTINIIAFVGFALVGSSFAPATAKGDNTNFRVLCYTLLMSRILLAVQYMVVGIFVGLAHRSDLFLPVFLNVFVYVASGCVYAGMIPTFSDSKPVSLDSGIYSVWWVVLSIETIATIAISSCWRMLSFKKTHLVERMGLLTLIVLGEGAIGVTKTISRMMGQNGLDPEGSGLVLCIVLLLIGIWMVYFDNHPHGHFGTIKQQVWSALHFPIHLALVGLVEGAQQIALARYMVNGLRNIEMWFSRDCFQNHLDGQTLTDALMKSIKTLQLDKKVESFIFLDKIQREIWVVGNATGICGPDVKGSGADDFPDELTALYRDTAAAVYSALDLSNPFEKDALSVMTESWKVVYRYFWSAYLMLMLAFVVVTLLIRTTKFDVYEFVALLNRGLAALITSCLLILSVDETLMFSLIGTPLILPIAVILMYLIIILDRLGAWIANRRNRKSGDALVGSAHTHGSSTQIDRGNGHGHQQDGVELAEAGRPHNNKRGSGVTDSEPFLHPIDHRHRSYNPFGGGSMLPSYSPIRTSPDPDAFALAASPEFRSEPGPSTPQPGFTSNTAYHPGGYAPVQNH